MKVTIVETLAYTIEVLDADEQTAIALAKETYEHGDIDYKEMTECGTEYQINDGIDCDDSVDMTLDKYGNNVEVLEMLEEWERWRNEGKK